MHTRQGLMDKVLRIISVLVTTAKVVDAAKGDLYMKAWTTSIHGSLFTIE